MGLTQTGHRRPDHQLFFEYRELYQRQVRTEAAAIRAVPDEEREELALIYEAKGLPQEEAHKVAEHLKADEQSALDDMVREELGLDPDTLGGSPYAAGATSLLLFSIGAVIPLTPYFIACGIAALVAAICCLPSDSSPSGRL